MNTLAFELNLHPIAVGILVALFVIVSFMLLLVILIQRPQGGGLSEAFGSNSGSGHTAFGAKTGDALTTATIGIFVVFIVVSVFLNYAVRPPTAVAAQAPTVTQPGTTPTSGVPSPSMRVETPVLPGEAPKPAPGATQESAIELKLPADGGTVTIPAGGQPTTVPAPVKPSETPATPAPVAPPTGETKPQ